MKSSLRAFSALFIAIFAVAGLQLPCAWSQAAKIPESYVLSVTTDRADALYKQGESVIFNVNVLHETKPVDEGEVQWSISKDGVPPITNGIAKLEHGVATLNGKLNEPGFLLCKVEFQAAEKKYTKLSGAGVDPLQIKPSMPGPEDFDEFWSTQKKKLSAVPAKSHLAPVKNSHEDVEAFDVRVDCLGAPVSGYLGRPTDAKPKSLPIILLVQGAGVRSSSLGGATEWASRGFLAMDINAHGITNGAPESFYADLSRNELKNYQLRGRESRDTVYFLGMFLRVIRALDFLTSQPEWDGRTVVVHGSSQGGAQSLAAAGIDSRVTFFAAGVPAMCDHTGVVAGRVNGWPKLVPNGTDDKPDLKVLEAARYFDAVNFASRASAPGMITVGFIDTTCPPTTVYAAYNVLKSKKEIFNDPPSPHTVTPEAGKAMRGAILKHATEHSPSFGPRSAGK